MASQSPDSGAGAQVQRVSRYPGVQPFGDGEIQRRLFRGRDEEKYELLQLVLAERLVLLFARSGIGKSSLINAGLLQPLREKGYFPVVVRVSGSSGSPLDGIYDGIKAAVDKAREHGQIDFEPPASEWNRTSLWHFFKTFEIWQNDSLLLPVLVIDQFEELFTVHGAEDRKQLIHQLADLVRGSRPRGTWDDVGSKLSETPPGVKVVLALREDFYANLEELRDRIPSIYKAPFRLNPLSRGQAKRAIVEPAALEGAYFSTPAFSWSDEALNMVLDFLSKQQLGEGKTRVGKEVEPFQLQLICQHLEEKVRARALTMVSAGDLGGVEALKAILSSFYEDSLQKICAQFPEEPGLREKLERLCEYGLITAKGRRLLREESTIKQDDGVGPDILRVMVELRLLRKEPRVGDNYYELTHDTLIEPIQLSRQAREEGKAREAQTKARKRRVLGGIAATVVFTALGAWALWERAETRQVTEAKQQALVQAEQALAGKRQALAEKRASDKVAVTAKLEAGEEEAKRRLAEAEAKLAEIQPIAIAAQKKVAEAKLQAIEAKGQDYEEEAKRLLAEAELELQAATRRVDTAQLAIFEAKTRVTVAEVRREDTNGKLAAAENAGGIEDEQPAQKVIEAEPVFAGTEQQAEDLEKRLPGAAPPPTIKVANSRVEEKAGLKIQAKGELAALELRETVPEIADAELVRQYRELLESSRSQFSADEVQAIESKIRELEQASEAFAELKRKDKDANFSVCEALDHWSAFQPRRALGPEAQYRDLRLAELNALLQDMAIVTTQENFITARGEGGRYPMATFNLGMDRVYIHAWTNSQRSEAVKIKIRSGASEESIWAGRVGRNPLRGVHMGFQVFTWKSPKAVGVGQHELRLYNAKNRLICRREFEVVAASQ